MGVVYGSETTKQANQTHKNTAEGSTLNIKCNEYQNRFMSLILLVKNNFILIRIGIKG